MKTTLSTAVAALALLALAGCGGTSDQASPGTTTPAASSAATVPSDSAAPSDPSAPPQSPGPAPTKSRAPEVTVKPGGEVVVPAGFKELPAKQVDVKALPEAYKERRVWASADGKSLQLVAVARDACAGVDAQVVESTDSTVKVSLTPMTSPQGGAEGGKVCAMVLTPRAVEVPLEKAVANRTVVVVEQG
ncbi:hypothetical protein [Actinokineospora sp. NBRC 105648]|uniref:hypothetical protein n=1 Tax=Actinokineospora sp. NBRC 105648 TaxID=3032206 RepID=UPI0024A35D6E|nr:hypothetical protein [Actinokineospora sp. NBRC 105648]GLZ38701.1 hypothetical protein Acsp05_23250 [Actinokineospora sp. NBRC 105648]